MGSNQDFSELVFKALKEIDYSGEKDNSRFLAAIQDLAIDYPNEKKFLERNADGRLIQYCGEAINCDEKQINVIQKRVSQYIQQECLILPEWADDISRGLILGFFSFGHELDVSELKGEITGSSAKKEVIDPKKIQTEANTNQRKKRLFVPGIIALVVICACGTFGLYNYYYCEVPDLIGMQEEEASQVIKEAGLVYVEDGRNYSDTIEKGHIISQNIKSVRVKRGTEIRVVVSRGEEVTVPDFKGKTVKKAKEKAKKLGLLIKVKKEKYSDSVKKGRIISQTPKADTSCEKGTVVDVVKSKGIEQVKVPDVIGETESKAKKSLKKAKLKVEVIKDYSSSTEFGRVISQSEAAGNKVDKGLTIIITISLGARPSYDYNREDDSSDDEEEPTKQTQQTTTKKPEPVETTVEPYEEDYY